MKIINSTWFTPKCLNGCIGVVVVDFDDGYGRQAFIGTGFGHNERFDSEYIAENGARFDIDQIKNFILQNITKDNV